MPEEPTSPRFKLDNIDVKKLLRSFGISVAGAAIVATAAWLEALPELDWGAYAPLVGAFAPWLANLVRLAWKNNVK